MPVTPENRSVPEVYGLTAAQREIWMADQAADDATAYSTAMVAHIRGQLEFADFVAAIEATFARAEVVQVRFVPTTTGEVVQERIPARQTCVVVDLRTAENPTAAARSWIEDDLARPYDTATGPLTRVTLLRVSDTEVLVNLSAHHLVLDGTAVGMLLSAALTRYGRGRSTGRAATTTDESSTHRPAWQLQSLIDIDEAYRSSPEFEADREFWLAQIDDAPPPPRLLTRGDLGARRAEIVAVDLSAAENAALYQQARTLGVRTAGLLMATLAGFLYRRTGIHDLVFATPMAARTTAELRAHLGTLATVLPLRVRIPAGATWQQVAGDIDETMVSLVPHSRFRGEDLRRALRDAGTPRALFGVGANVLPLSSRSFAEVGLDTTLEILSSGPTGDIDVFFEVDASARTLHIYFHGPGSQRAEMTAIAAEFADYLRELMADPWSPIGPALDLAVSAPAPPASGPLAGTFPGTEEWVVAHDHPSAGDEPVDGTSHADGTGQATIFSLPTPPHASLDQVRAVVAAVRAAHPEIDLRAGELAPGLWEYEFGDGVVADAGTQPVTPELCILEPGVDPLAEGVLTSVPGAVVFAWQPGRRGKPGALLIAAHPLLMDARGREIVRDDVATAWADIEAATVIELPVADAPEDLVRRLAARAVDADVTGELDYWHDLLREASRTSPVTAAPTMIAGAHEDVPHAIVEVDANVFGAVGLDPAGMIVAAYALALGSLETVGSPRQTPVVTVGRDGRGDRAVGGARSILPLGVATPVRVPVGTGAAEVLRRTRRALDRQSNGGNGFGLLRYLHPQAGATLADAPAVPAISVVDERGMTILRQSTPEPPTPEPHSAMISVRLTENGIELGVAGPVPGQVEPQILLAALEAALLELAQAALDPANHVVVQAGSLVAVALSPAELALVGERAARPVTAVWGLSPLQSGLYFQSALSGDLDVYNAQFVLEFEHGLDPDRLRRALAALMDDHPTLSSGFTHEGLREPVQFILGQLTPPLEIIDQRGATGAELSRATDEIIAADRTRRFDPADPPLWHVILIRRSDGDQLVVSRRFMIWDGWSNGVFIEGLLRHYAADTRPRLAAPGDDADEPVFARYLQWLGQRDRVAAKAAWANHLDGYDEPALLRPGADPVVRGETRVQISSLTTAQSEGLAATAQRSGVTLNTVLAAVITLVTARWSGRTDVAIGQTVAGRPADVAGSDSAIGMFLNTVPVRTQLRPEVTVRDFLRAQQDRWLDVLEHDWLSLGEIAADAHTQVLFDVLLVLQNFISDDQLGAEYGVRGHRSDDHTHFALTVVITPGERLQVKAETRADLITDDAAAGMFADLLALLGAFADGGCDDLALARLPIAVSESAQHGRELAVPELSVSEMLAQTAALHRDAPALIFADTTLSFGELDDEINRLSRLLLAGGAGPETVVALAIERSIEMVVALFAVLRTGAAYLPLELVHPPERLHRLVTDARPVLALTAGADPDAAAEIFADTGVAPIDLRAPATRESLAHYSGDVLDAGELGAFAPDRPRRLDHPAYIIYTSGSTGAPKGVVTGYRGLTNMYLNHEDEIFRPAVALAGVERLAVAHTVSFAFDMSWEELLWLTYGHTVHVCDENLRRDPQALVDYCDQHRIDVINVTPTYAEYLMSAGLLEQDSPGSHRPALVLLGGEAVSTGVWDGLAQAPGTLGYNLYGPTEYTINTLGGGTTDSATPTVGRPISNTIGHLLDPWLRPVPPGVAGELYVEGDGLARGYHNRFSQTALSFVAHPADPGQRLYRTGDLMRRRDDGLLDYLGRTDFQIKVRGYRVEPAEIEAALTAIDGITHAVVVARGAANATSLAAYLVIDGSAPATEAIRRRLADSLPPYMVPATFTVIDSIPVNVNGKRDLAALPEPSTDASGPSRAGSLLERVLAELAAETFGVDAIDFDTNLFDLGAHSLQLMSFAGAVRSRLGVTLAVSQVFTNPTIAAIAAVLDDNSDTGEQLRAPVIGFRSGGVDTPVVILPPGTGLGWRYGQLLAHIPDTRSVYAVQSPQISGNAVAADLDSAAEYFAAQIDQAVEPGPVVLLGWSFGGSMAPAVIDSLTRRGRTVEALALIDAFAESPAEYFAYMDTISPHAAALSALDVAVPAELSGDLTREQAIELVARGDSVFAGLDPAVISAVLDSSQWSLDLMRLMRAPTAAITVPVLYVEASPAGSLATWAQSFEPAAHLTVEWMHSQLLGPDAVGAWGPKLAEFLQD